MTDEKQDDWVGVLLVLAAAATFSTAGFFIRLIPADAWTMLFWRGVFGGLFIAVFALHQVRWRPSDALHGLGLAGLGVAACSTVGTICFINALQRTSVANVTLIYATAPFAAAAIGWLCWRQREGMSTLLAGALALAGVALVFVASPSGGQVLGNVLALAMTVLIAAMMLLIRRYRATPMLFAACLSAFASSALALPLARPLSPTAIEFVWLALFGSGNFGLGLLLLTLGSRRLSAARSALIGNLEIPLAPALVWLAFGEMPGPLTWIGGGMVVLAVVGDVVAGHRRATSN